MMSVSPSGHERKARESNPHPPEENHVSTVARPTVSGYLPYQWTHPDSNRDRQHARLESSHWTMGPFLQWTAGDSNSDSRLAKPVSSRWTSSPVLDQ